MKRATKDKLRGAMDWCDVNDKSTEFMIQFMMDIAKVPHECVIKYLKTDGGFKQQPNSAVRK